jgi:Pyruvate/2-oxoacid:ferredoxin oxidoreductase delta subunit
MSISNALSKINLDNLISIKIFPTPENAWEIKYVLPNDQSDVLSSILSLFDDNLLLTRTRDESLSLLASYIFSSPTIKSSTNVTVQLDWTPAYRTIESLCLPSQTTNIFLYPSKLKYSEPEILFVSKDKFHVDHDIFIIGLPETQTNQLIHSILALEQEPKNKSIKCKAGIHKWEYYFPFSNGNIFHQRKCSRCKICEENCTDKWVDIKSPEYQKIMNGFDRPAFVMHDKDWIFFSADENMNIIHSSEKKDLIISAIRNGTNPFKTFTGKRDRTCKFPNTIDDRIEQADVQQKNGIYFAKGYEIIWFENQYAIPRKAIKEIIPCN